MDRRLTPVVIIAVLLLSPFLTSMPHFTEYAGDGIGDSRESNGRSYSISPTNGTSTGGTNLTITGTGFDALQKITLSSDSSLIGHWKFDEGSEGEWSTIIVDFNGNVGYDVSLALDSNDEIHISYKDDTNSALKYAHFDGDSWSTLNIDSDGDIGSDSSIAIDSNDEIHISYNNFVRNCFKNFIFV